MRKMVFGGLLGALALLMAIPATITAAHKEGVNSSGWNVTVFAQDFNPTVIQTFNQLPPIQDWQGGPFPNVDNSATGFTADKGIEKDVWQECLNDTCNIVVPPRSITAIAASWDLGINCYVKPDSGCLLIVVNVGNTTITYPNAQIGNGLVVTGRYRNGEPQALATTVSAISSYISSIELNQETDITHSGMTSYLGQCGTAEGCPQTNIMVLVADPRSVIEATTSVSR